MTNKFRSFTSYHTILAIILTVTTAGCSIGGATRPSQFFVLDSVSITTYDKLSDLMLGVGPIIIPGYIDRPQIVSKSDSAELHYAEYERWAEPMDEMLTRIITQNITKLTQSNNIVSHPWSSNANITHQLSAKIVKFENDMHGDALLIVQWQLLDKNSGNSNSTYSEYKVPAAGSKYSERISALNLALDQFANDVMTKFISNN